MDEKIRKLLLSSDKGDTEIGWELLNRPENKPEGEEWWPWFDVFRSNSLISDDLNDSFIIRVVGKDYHDSELWQNWPPKVLNI